MFQPGVRFERVGVVAPDRGAARAGARSVAPLHGKTVLAVPDHRAVIVSRAGQPHEIVDGHWRGVRVQHRADFPQAGGENGDQVPVGRRRELPLLTGDPGAGRHALSIAAAAAQQGQQQGQGHTDGLFHGRSSRNTKNTSYL